MKDECGHRSREGNLDFQLLCPFGLRGKTPGSVLLQGERGKERGTLFGGL